ncbi:AAA family ATPase [Polaromonas sp. P1-6]|nr:AAA family ATPase [Polaromonas sp. P1-6]
MVQAPAGFGKTSLLAQWRREYLALGVVVAWVSAQAGDDPRRLAQSLALAVRVAAGRPGFGHGLLEAGAPGGMENITVFLAELAQAALNVVLIIDEADRLPAASREALVYLLRNAPANLRTVVAARADCQLGVDDLVDYGKCAAIGAEALRFRFEETLELVRGRF